eukprot:gene114-3506_t
MDCMGGVTVRKRQYWNVAYASSEGALHPTVSASTQYVFLHRIARAHTPSVRDTMRLYVCTSGRLEMCSSGFFPGTQCFAASPGRVVLAVLDDVALTLSMLYCIVPD